MKKGMAVRKQSSADPGGWVEKLECIIGQGCGVLRSRFAAAVAALLLVSVGGDE